MKGNGANDSFPGPEEVIRSFLRWLRGFHLHRERPKVTDWVIAALTVVVAIAAIVSAWIFQGQLREARRSTDNTIEAFRMDERAWVELDQVKPIPFSPRDSKFGAVFEYDLYLKNVGKTAARDVEFRANRSGAIGSPANGNDAKGLEWDQEQLMMGKVPSGADIPFLNPFERVLAPNTTTVNPFVFRGQEPINGMVHYFIGRVDYSDVFGIKHWKKFCFFVASPRGEFWPCREGNDEDKF